VACASARADGRPDLTLNAPTPALTDVPSQSRMGANTMIHLVDGVWHQSWVQTNTLSFAQCVLPCGVELVRHGGPLSQLLDGLGVSTVVRFDVVQDAQLMLNLPTPLKAFDEPGCR
jgi:hypothetical protein